MKKPESEWTIRTDIMSGTIELPTEELRKQFRHTAFPIKLFATSTLEEIPEVQIVPEPQPGKNFSNLAHELVFRSDPIETH